MPLLTPYSPPKLPEHITLTFVPVFPSSALEESVNMQGVRASLVSLNHGRAMVWLISYNENHEYRALLLFFFYTRLRPTVCPSVRPVVRPPRCDYVDN
jgi:hypothetical protein